MFKELYDSLDKGQQVAFEFKSERAFVRAVKHLVSNRIEHELPGRDTVIVHGQDTKFIKQKFANRDYTEREVIASPDATPEERAAFRRIVLAQ